MDELSKKDLIKKCAKNKKDSIELINDKTIKPQWISKKTWATKLC